MPIVLSRGGFEVYKTQILRKAVSRQLLLSETKVINSSEIMK